MFKKAQGISINVIIIAAIALLVLVILAILVLNAGKKTDEGTKKCFTLGGKCQERYCDEGMDLEGASDCGDGYCCQLIGLE
ncbi:MAG: hypothetical protein ABIJ21_05750 [Nanoarchaeota archaeon]